MKEKKESAAGGIVARGDKVLLVQVKNLEGEVVWTFPKGHLEEGETWIEAALREVEEETGWKCRNIGPVARVSYRFRREGRPVFKKVRWFRMEPVKKTRKPDADEVRRVKWVERGAAVEALSYPSDLKLLKKFAAGAAAFLLLAAAARAGAPARGSVEELTRRVAGWEAQKRADEAMRKDLLAYYKPALAAADRAALAKELDRIWSELHKAEFDMRSRVKERRAEIGAKAAAGALSAEQAKDLAARTDLIFRMRMFYLYGNLWRRSISEIKTLPAPPDEALGGRLAVAIDDAEYAALKPASDYDPAKYGLRVYPPARYGDGEK